MSYTVLVVDDEPSIRSSMKMILQHAGYRFIEAANGTEGLEKIASEDPDVVILDVKMPEMDGLDVLEALKGQGSTVPVIVVSGHGDIETAVRATKLGAFNFIEKPFGEERVLVDIRNALEQSRLRRKAASLEVEVEQQFEMVGASQQMQALREHIQRAAPTQATVLVTGESGTGKELVARAIHANSGRRDAPFIRVNCAAIPDDLIESELFGHERGSFTGATGKQVGKFLQADHGTIFLDEIGDMSARTQAKVLRALETGEIEPVGAARVIVVDVRVIAATNRDLPAEDPQGELPRGSLFPPQGDPDRVSSPSRARRGHPAPRGALRPGVGPALLRGRRARPGGPALERQCPRAEERHRAYPDHGDRLPRGRYRPGGPSTRGAGDLAVRRRLRARAPRRRRRGAHHAEGLQGGGGEGVHPVDAREVRLEHLAHRQGDRHAPQQPLQEARAVRHREGQGHGRRGFRGMTIPQLFDRAVADHVLARAVTHWSPRFEKHLSSEELRKQVARCAAGLRALGLRKGDRVLIISENRPEWAIADQATLFAGGILVPVYTSLTVPQLRYILENSGACIGIASTQTLIDKLIDASAGLPAMRQTIVIDESAAAPDAMHLASVSAMGDDLLAGSPDAWRERAETLRDDEVATIIYTSGTTGPPKGVMLTHRNLTSNVDALCRVLEFGREDVSLSFLPLCHIIQRIGDYCYLSRGVRVVYLKLEDVSAGLTAIRPTTFPGVPRVYEKAREAILARGSASPAPVRALFRWALETGRRMERTRLEGAAPGAWLRLRHAIADRLILSKVRRGLGGRIRYLVSGGAPLNPEILEFFLSVGIPILEGYGLTETSVLTINTLTSIRPGTVGAPLPGVELRLLGDGEVLARGDGVGRGYYLDVKKTEESFVDGWFATGDLGRLDERGHLVITGRKKEILVTSGGKKVSPAGIEQTLLSSPLVSQAVVVGDGRKYVSALLVPDRAQLLAACRARGIAGGGNSDWASFLQRDEVREMFQRIVSDSNRPLSRFEQIKKFVLLPSELTQEGGELTPTLKIKRRVVEEKHRGLIDALYDETGRN